MQVENDLSLMPTQPEKMLSVLEELGVSYTLHHHEALFTVAESKNVDKEINAHHTRNMFLRTKKKQNFLITLSHDTPIDLKKLEIALDAKRFSFGSPDRLMEILGVFPGSVTPFSIMNARPDEVSVVFEKKMMDADQVAFHPLINTMTVCLHPKDLMRFAHHYGHNPIIIDMKNLAPS